MGYSQGLIILECVMICFLGVNSFVHKVDLFC